MSTLKADTIVASDGTSPVTLTKQEAAKAYFSHSQTSLNQSFNISSIEDHSTGNVKGYYTNTMDTSTNPLAGGNNNVSTSGAANYSTGFAAASSASYYWVEREYANGSAFDMAIFSGATFGDLA